MSKVTKETISFKDAMDNLAVLSALNGSAAAPIGIVGKNRIVIDEEEFPEASVLWLSGESAEPLLEILDATFRSLHDYLIQQSKEMDWGNEKERRAVEGMMALAAEGADRLGKVLENRLDKPISITDRESWQSLQDYYQRFSERFQEGEPREVKEEGLNDMEAVRLDRDYELFYIRKDDGRPYFSTDLLRHVRLFSDFGTEGESFEDDPLLQVRSMLDRDLQASAQQILGECPAEMREFFKIYRRISQNDLAATLSQAMMALFLAANPRNLIQNTTKKSCQSYFEDFLFFLRAAFKTDEYQKLVAYPPEQEDKRAHMLLHITHKLSYELFHRKGGVKREAIGLIHRTTRKGKESSQATVLKKGDTLWNQLSLDDENYRTRLSKFPSGPLFKTLDLVRQEENDPVPFDPVQQANFPLRTYELHLMGEKTAVLHLPCPTRQFIISKVEILDEFRGMLRYCNARDPKEKHLIINHQNRTSWKEFARSKALEQMQKNAEFSGSLVVITVPKDTDFYTQANEYMNIAQAGEFISIFLKQFDAPEECGFYFPASFKPIDLANFAKAIVPIIHRDFFQQKETLSRRQREDFIEIFYQFLILKILDHYKPDSLSFTSKDSLDTGAAQSALFYGFVKLLDGGFKDAETIDYFRWLLSAPALFVRERAIDSERIGRVLTALERFEAGMKEHGKAVIEACGKLYRAGIFKGLAVS